MENQQGFNHSDDLYRDIIMGYKLMFPTETEKILTDASELGEDLSSKEIASKILTEALQ